MVLQYLQARSFTSASAAFAAEARQVLGDGQHRSATAVRPLREVLCEYLQLKAQARRRHHSTQFMDAALGNRAHSAVQALHVGVAVWCC